MGIRVIQRLGDGSLGEVDSDVLGIGRRIQEGDGTLGWVGKPDMELCFDHDSDTWVVVDRDAHGDRYIAVRHHTCDENLIRKLVAADPTKHDVFAEVRAQKLAAEAAAAKAWDDQLDNDLIPKARWAMRRDTGWDTRGQHSGYRKALDYPALILPKGS